MAFGDESRQEGHTGVVTELLASGVPFNFLSRTPDPPLDRLVESVWYARGTVPYRREKIAPTGSTVAVFVLGDAILQTPSNGEGRTFRAERGFLIGPHDRPTVNEPIGETFAVGIVTTPIGCQALFGIAPSTVRGEAVDLEQAWAAAAEVSRRLRRIAADGGAGSRPGRSAGAPPSERLPSDLLRVVEEALLGGYDPNVPGLDRCERAIELLEADPTRPIANIASELEISHGHLDREFTRIVGLTPRSLARLLRMRRLLQRIDVRAEVSWSDHAAELGWFDQAHLIRDFKRHTGVTPSAYLAAQRAAYTTVAAGDAAGFVPEH